MKLMRVRLAFRNSGSDPERFMERVVEYDPATQDPPADWTWSLLPREEGWATVTDVRFIHAVEVTATKAGRKWTVVA